jgi:hypothetical protein
VSLYPEEVVLPTGFGWLDPAGGWRTEILTANASSLDVTVEYPRFSEELLGNNATAVNDIVRRRVDASMTSFNSFKDEPPDGAGPNYYLQGSFSCRFSERQW